MDVCDEDERHRDVIISVWMFDDVTRTSMNICSVMGDCMLKIREGIIHAERPTAERTLSK